MKKANVVSNYTPDEGNIYFYYYTLVVFTKMLVKCKSKILKI